MNTPIRKNKDLAGRKWYLFDAKDKVLGRLATRIATVLRGKNKVDFTPHMDSGDFVVVVNASKVRLTGTKLEKKIYYRHTFRLGGLKTATAGELLKKHPDEVIRRAVKGMLPKNILGRRLLAKMKVYAGADHPHKAQMPQDYESVSTR